jgi:hypothetical protein
MSSYKRWADRENIASGVFGETYRGITIKEENRATTWEFRRSGIEMLQKILKENYLDKGVHAVLFGVYDSPDTVKYAIFCRDGFLRHVGEDD